MQQVVRLQYEFNRPSRPTPLRTPMTFVHPMDLFEAAVTALREGDLQRAAELCDPVSLRMFHRQLCEQFDSSTGRFGLTAEMLMRASPDMPRDVAEYQIARMRQNSDPERRLREELPSVASVEELRALEPAAAFAAWLDGRSPRRQIAALVKAGEAPPGALANQQSFGRLVHHYVTLGVVSDGDDVAYVLYRHQADESTMRSAEAVQELASLPADEQTFVREQWLHQKPMLLPCRRQADGPWRLHADYDFFEATTRFVGGIGGDSGNSGVSEIAS